MSRYRRVRLFASLAVLPAALVFLQSVFLSTAYAELKVGAAVVDVTPNSFPVYVNGGMTARTTSNINTPINARAIVLDDGRERIGIVVVDSCMVGREVLDEAKTQAMQKTQLRHDRILISSTHTHTAPSSMDALGTPAQQDYLPVLRAGIAEALATAEANLESARVGFAVGNAAEYTALRRWIRRPDRLAADPFGNMTVRANMHSGRVWDDVTGESGPEDPDLSMISFQSKDGRPIALLANFSMHYFSGPQPLDYDYFGRFCKGLEAKLERGRGDHPPFVAAMSHGCSGDIWRRDYKLPPDEQEPYGDIDQYAAGLVDITMKAYESIDYDDSADLAMAETRMTLKYRVPDLQRLEWAQRVVNEMGDRLPNTQPEVYAVEQIILYERQATEIVVQGIRIGDIGIATTPTETYALTGLKIKEQSPLPHRTMVMELANGGDGYIPPPEQHLLGGYNTWPARSAGLEIQAEPRITETAIQMLEQVAGQPRNSFRQSRGSAATAVEDAKPIVWYRMDEMAGSEARDASGHNKLAVYEPAIAFFLEGPRSDLLCENGETNRCAHFAGDRLRTHIDGLGDEFAIAMWFWNGMPSDAREVAGWMFSRDHEYGMTDFGCHLGVGGTATQPGKLILQCGRKADATVGTTTIDRWTWNHVVLSCKNGKATVYLNGRHELDAPMDAATRSTIGQLFFGGRSDNDSNWEGRLDEVAVFDRGLTEKEASSLAGK